MEVSYLRGLRVAAQPRGHAVIMHRHKDGIGAHQTKPEMPARQFFIHHAAKHFGKPVVGRSEYSEDRRDPHDQVEMADYEIRLMQIDIECWLRQKRAANTAGHKQGDESQGKQHRRSEAYSPA